MPQSAAPFFQFHIDHIRARQHGGGDGLENLALACPDCNAFKGPNLSGVDPETDQIAPLFHPQRDHWRDHFEGTGDLIVGWTPTGRATVHLLRMDDTARLKMRAVLGTELHR